MRVPFVLDELLFYFALVLYFRYFLRFLYAFRLTVFVFDLFLCCCLFISIFVVVLTAIDDFWVFICFVVYVFFQGS